MAEASNAKQDEAPQDSIANGQTKQWVDRFNDKGRITVKDNAIILRVSDKDHAFIVDFERNPNEGLPKGEKHQAIGEIHRFLGELQAERQDGYSAGGWLKSKVDGK